MSGLGDEFSLTARNMICQKAAETSRHNGVGLAMPEIYGYVNFLNLEAPEGRLNNPNSTAVPCGPPRKASTTLAI